MESLFTLAIGGTVLRLSEEQIGFFYHRGYLPVEDQFSSAHTSRLTQRIEELCEDWRGDAAREVGILHEREVLASLGRITPSNETVGSMANIAASESLFRDHAADPDLIRMVSDLIGEPVRLFSDRIVLKPPRLGSEKPFHQDNAYFHVLPEDAFITCWCALDDATLENGCLHYFPGSHTKGTIDHEKIPKTPHLVPRGIDPKGCVPVSIRSGGVIFHHGLTIHTSGPNRSERWRRAYICHYVRTDAEYPLKPGYPVDVKSN